MKKWFILSVIVICLDQLTKYYVIQTLRLYESHTIFPYVRLSLVHNTGAAFSFLSQAGGWQRWFFIGLAFLISAIIINWIYRLPANRNCLAAALALILGGALGNVCDRLAFGYVVDFIEVSLPFLPWALFNPWPIFNIADTAITIGTIMLLMDAFFFNQ